MKKDAEESVPTQMRPIFDEITLLTDAVCKEHLNEDYAQLCRKLTAVLCRKRPSPLVSGNLRIWACAILYAIATTNVLFHPSQDPTMTVDQLCGAFDVSTRTGGAKSKVIRDLLKIRELDPDWCAPGTLENKRLGWRIFENYLFRNVRGR